MVDTPSSPVDAISCDFSTSAADSEAKVSSEMAWSLRIEPRLERFWMRTRATGRRERLRDEAKDADEERREGSL